MLLQPKKRPFLTKKDGKYRLNSATNRRTQYAISTANDEARLHNFIQNENYEINSFRSNDKGGENLATERLRESLHRA